MIRLYKYTVTNYIHITLYVTKLDNSIIELVIELSRFVMYAILIVLEYYFVIIFI